MVEMMTAFGIPQEQIARVLTDEGLSVDTLQRYFDREIKTGLAKANTKVAMSLFKQAIGGNVTAQIFWLKTRARWQEVVRVEPAEDGTLNVNVVLGKS